MKNKFKIFSIVITLSIISISFFVEKISIKILIPLLILALILMVFSLVKKEGKKLISIVFILINIILIIILLLYGMGDAMLNSNSTIGTITNSRLAKISPYMSNFTQDGNIIDVSFYNNGDDITLTLEGGSKSNVCQSPMLTAYNSKNEPILAYSQTVKNGEKFSIKWDCTNEIKLGDLYDGNLFFDYIRNNNNETYQFYMHGWYK